MSHESFNWHDFLRRWQDEWVPHPDAEGEESGIPLGEPGADAAAIVAAEKRLGVRLPPSYREFLAVSDGWVVEQPAAIHRLGGAADIQWFGDPHAMTALYEERLGEEPSAEEVLLAGMWRRALRLETESDASHALLDPGDLDEDGEWALYVYKGWSGEVPDRHPSFRAYMEAMYRGFHAERAGSPEFVNATTRAQDARVEWARRLALRGRYEEAVPVLEEARSFGRPGGRVLLDQIRHLMAPGTSPDYGFLAADPRYLPEVLPVQAAPSARGEWRPGGDDHWLGTMTARGVPREALETVLGSLRDGTHRYAPPGPWGRAVAEARESARWGPTDAAWRILREALPLWEAPGPSLIAPVGLLADPLLGVLVTPERGREILATPRAGESGPAPEPVPDLDPPGLVWLTEPVAHQQSFDGFRCVWVEGADPARLPALIGEEGEELSGPVDARTTSWRAPRPHQREGVELWEDRAVVAVGRTAEAWAFAFDGYSSARLSPTFRSPAAAASASGRAVAVWCDPWRRSPGDGTGAFHLSVAEDGEELCSLTVRGAEAECSGALPEALDPARLFRPEDREEEGVRRALRALHTALGLSLPRLALTRSRLRTFTTRSWTRAPREGEGYGYLRFERHRP
ncbi:SMI1/KNR4 family protein [Streptomyces sp. NPDC059695]|uniref:SMI1/KNR4 family protein n=1 Tax=Streptomyces sp. NPDC059695 TaxID=3346910 RepID=UPI0036A6AD74